MKKRAKAKKKKSPPRSNGKHPGGRPREYGDHTVSAVEDYLKYCEKEKVGAKKRPMVPTIAGLAVYLEISRETVYAWMEEYEEFSDIIKRLLSIQEEKLLAYGLSGDFDHTIAKLILTKHGYADKVESKNEHSHSLGALFDEAAKRPDTDE